MTNLTKKIVAIATGLTFAAMLFPVVPVQAVTAEELQDQIDALMETLADLQDQLAELTGEPAAAECSCTFTRNLYPGGERGDDVKCLQEYLNDSGHTLAESGAGSPGSETTYFGSLTRAAVKVWQDANDVEYGDWWGYFGPVSQAKYDETCAVGEQEEEEEEEEEEEPSGLTVALASDTPVSAIVPMAATYVVYTKFDVTAGSDAAVTIEDLVITRGGVGAAADFAYVYLYNNSTRLTTGKTVNSNTNQARLNNVDFEIAAGTTESLSLVGEIGTTAGTDYLEISSADDIITDASAIIGTFPIRGNSMTISPTVTAGSVTISKHGVLTDPYVGQKDVKIAQFKLTAVDEDISFEQVNLIVKGTISGNDVTGLILYDNDDNELASTDALTSKDLAEFLLDSPVIIDEGDDEIYYVTADLVGESTETIKVFLDERTDLVCTGATYGFGVSVTMTDYGNSNDDGTDGSHTTLQGGDVTFVLNGPSAANVAIDSDDVEFLDVTLTTNQEITVKQIDVLLTADGGDTASDNGDLIRGAGTEGNLKDIKIVDEDGDVLVGPESLVLGAGTTGDDAQTISFTDTFTLDAGESITLSLRVDIDNNCPADQIFYATMDIDTNLDIEDANGDSVPAENIVPSTDIQGNSFTTVAAELTVSSDASVQSATKVVGSEVNLVSIGFAAAEGSDLTVDQLVISGYIDDDGNNSFTKGQETGGHYFKDVVLSMKLYEGSVADANQIGTVKSANAAGEATFDNLDWEISAGDTVKLYVTGVLTTVATFVAAPADEVKVDIAETADVVAYDADGNVAGVTGATPNGAAANSGAQILLSAGGALVVDIPTDTPNSDIVVMGSSDNAFSKIKFTATKEDFLVSKFAMKNDYGSSAGDYDADISSISVTYPTDAKATETETKECTLSGGLVTCTGLSLLVPNPDITGNKKYATVVVKADIQTDAEGATAADVPGFTLSLAGDFEAIGASSGNKIYEQTIGITDAVTAVDTGVDTNATTTDSTTTVSAASGFAATVVVGDIVKLGTEEMYVSAVSDTALTVVRGVNNTTAAAHNNATDVYVYGAANATLDVMAVNAMTVYETDLALDITGPTISGNTNASEEILKFDLIADSAGDVVIHRGYEEACESLTNLTLDNNAGAAGDLTSTTESTIKIGGDNSLEIGVSSTTVDNLNAFFYQFSAGDAADYSRVSFWLRWDEQDGTTALGASDLAFITDDNGDNASGQHKTALTTEFASDKWYFIDMAVPSGTVSGDDYFGIEVTDAATLFDDNIANKLYFDQVRFYNEKINVDLALNENWASAVPTLAYLKQGGNTVADAYVDFDGATSTKTGQIIFVPVDTHGDIVISESQSFVIEMDTVSAITDDALAAEKLSVTIDEGNSGTPGDIYWNTGSILVDYTGINATDKQSNTLSY